MEFSKPPNDSDVEGRTNPSVRSRAPAERAGAAGSIYGRLVGWGSRRNVPAPLRPLAYRAFARAVGANLDEVELALNEYRSLGEFFVRKLRDGARTVDSAVDAIVSPCDGAIAARGIATDGAMIQAKGKDYRLEELLADHELAAKLTGGAYMTIYLSPRDYHRVHTPTDALVESYDYLPGYLYPVNRRSTEKRDQLLSKNERVVIRLHAGKLGTVAVVMVAATGVGNIDLVGGEDSPVLRKGKARRRVVPTAPAGAKELRVARGDELGAFKLGSTVVLVFEPGKATLSGEVGQALRFGERIGSRT